MVNSNNSSDLIVLSYQYISTCTVAIAAEAFVKAWEEHVIRFC